MVSIFDAGRQMLHGMYDQNLNGVKVNYVRDGAVLLQDITAKLSSWWMYKKTADFNVRSHSASFKFPSASLNGVTPQLRDVIRTGGREYLVVKGDGDGCWKWSSERARDEIVVYAKYSGVEQVEEQGEAEAQNG